MLLANYAGQIINREEIGRSIGIDNKTVQAWLEIPDHVDPPFRTMLTHCSGKLTHLI
jgi:hypothetical protein